MNPRRRDRIGLFSAEMLTMVVTFLLGLWGLLTIASSQSAAPQPLLLAGRQLGALAGGMLVMYVAGRIPFGFYRGQIPVLAGLFFLLLLLLPLFGVRINGMCGWFRFGEFHLQPSEPAKGIYLLSLCVLISQMRSDNLKFAAGMILAALWVLPIVLQPDFGTAAIYFAGFAAVYFLAGGRWRNLLMLFGAGAVSVSIFLCTHSYALKRITGLFDPESDPLGSGWHIRQFELAIARGHYFGGKLGNAVWSNAYLPLPYNDSAYATMSETLGFFGTLPLWIGFAVLIGLLFRMSYRMDLENDARLYLGGTAALLAVQTLVHVSVNLCLLPPTGLTLPLISFGGSSLIGCCLMLGIAISAGRSSKTRIRGAL